MKRQALWIGSQRERVRDERCLASLRRDPTDDGTVAGQVQANVGASQLGEAADSRTYRVGELGHHQVCRFACILHGGRREIDTVGEESIELGAHVTIDPLGVGLPASDSLESGGALERQGLDKSSVNN